MSISEAVPVKVRVLELEPEIVTLPDEEATKVPDPAAIVRVKLEPVESTSERDMAERSRLPCRSSVKVTDAGTPVSDGASFTAVMLTFTVPVVVLFAPAWSSAVRVMVSALVPALLVAPVYWMLDAVFR